jgi:hypothetical protein
MAGTFGATLLGWRVQAAMSDDVLSADLKDVLKVVIGVLGTLSALVLSLLINSSRTSYDQQHQEIMELSAKLLSLDRTLGRYGPEAAPLRQNLKSLVAKSIEELWPADSAAPARVEAPTTEELWVQSLQSLAPKSESQRLDRDLALGLATDVLNLRWLLFEQSDGSIPGMLLAVLGAWFVLIFLCIGLISPRRSHGLLRALVMSSCLSVSAAMVLGLELDRPFDGILRVSGEPVRKALSHLGG